MKEDDIKEAYKLKSAKEDVTQLIKKLKAYDEGQLENAKLIIELATGGIRETIALPFNKQQLLLLIQTKTNAVNTRLEALGVNLTVGIEKD